MTYHEMVLPSEWVQVCNDCGAVIASTDAHDHWHAWGERYTEPATPAQEIRGRHAKETP